MGNFTMKMIGLAVVLFVAAGSVRAEWGTPKNPGVLVDNSEMYGVEKARTSDGGEYIIWTAATSRNGHMTFDLYGQYLDPQGNKMWGEDGKLIDSHQTPSWYSYWNIQVTPDDDVVISWADARSQENGEPLAEYENYEAQVPVLYKITKAGEMLWGDEGVVLDEAKYRYPVQLMAVGATLYAKCFSADDYGPTELQMLDEFGEFAWAEGKQFAGQIIGSEGTDFIGIYAGSNCVEAMRYSKDMEPRWDKAAFISERMYGGYDINPYKLKSDGKGGMVFSYLAALGDFSHIPMIGYVTADGETAFCEQLVDTQEGDHQYCEFGVNTEEESIMSIWQMNMGSGVVQAEKYDYFGERMWGDMGLTLAEKESYSGYSFGTIAVEPMDDNKWLVCYADEIGWDQNQLYLAVVGSDGSVEWRLPVGDVGAVQDVQMYKEGNKVELVWSCIGESYDDDWNKTIFGMVMGVRTELGTSGVKPIAVDVVEGEDKVYTLDGIRVDKPVKGVNIIRKANGKTKKVMVK